MVSAEAKRTKLVYPAAVFHKYSKKPDSWTSILKDGNYSVMGSAESGHGKDAVFGQYLDVDMINGRTPIIFDVKMEYPCSIFTQQDTVLKNILQRTNLYGKGYKVNLWLPYVKGMYENQHFQDLLKYHHPNLKIRPFRILRDNFVSEDSANMAMSKSQLQSMANNAEQLEGSGMTAKLNELRESMAKDRLAFDDQDYSTPGCGWEYIDIDEMTTNKEINVLSTFFMLCSNTTVSVSFMIGLMNELLQIGKGAHRVRHKSECFSVYIPELQIILPKGVKALDDIVNTLQYNMLVGLLLMRSFGVRLRINLQNLSAIKPDMLSQSRIFVGKTKNPKDLNLLNVFGVKKLDKIKMQSLQIGKFYDVFTKELFSVIPFCHKARQNEPFLLMLKDYKNDPSMYLYEVNNALLSEIVDYKMIFRENRPLTVDEYNSRVKAWMKEQEERSIKPFTGDDAIIDNLDHYEDLKGCA